MLSLLAVMKRIFLELSELILRVVSSRTYMPNRRNISSSHPLDHNTCLVPKNYSMSTTTDTQRALPVELIGHILNQLREDRMTVKSCSFVSHTFLELARRILFSTLLVPMTNRSLDDLRRFLQSSPTICRLVKRLELNGTETNPRDLDVHDLIGILDPLQNLSELLIELFCITNASVASVPSKRSARRLSFLELRCINLCVGSNCTDSVVNFFSILTIFDTIDILHITYPYTGYLYTVDISEYDAKLSRLTQLDRLKTKEVLVANDAYNSVLYRGFQVLLHLPALQVLHAVVVDAREATSLFTFAYKSQVPCLRLAIWDFASWDDHSDDDENYDEEDGNAGDEDGNEEDEDGNAEDEDGNAEDEDSNGEDEADGEADEEADEEAADDEHGQEPDIMFGPSLLACSTLRTLHLELYRALAPKEGKMKSAYQFLRHVPASVQHIIIQMNDTDAYDALEELDNSKWGSLDLYLSSLPNISCVTIAYYHAIVGSPSNDNDFVDDEEITEEEVKELNDIFQEKLPLLTRKALLRFTIGPPY
ncbi:hypothetical protein K474DRAFT_1773587 [Panus rudis PR-1116 ss-1]|nr:hypothetical protein K474DRAFT_1773587 [Panus rudis PR-1116 ss-1]